MTRSGVGGASAGVEGPLWKAPRCFSVSAGFRARRARAELIGVIFGALVAAVGGRYRRLTGIGIPSLPEDESEGAMDLVRNVVLISKDGTEHTATLSFFIETDGIPSWGAEGHVTSDDPQAVAPGATYTLRLDDGGTGTVLVRKRRFDRIVVAGSGELPAGLFA